MAGKEGHSHHVPHREGGMDAHGFGTRIEIASERPLEPRVVEELLRRLVTEIAELCLEDGARAIGHIKCYLKTEQGHAKADIVRLKQGAYSEVRLGSAIARGSLVINSILLGLPEESIEEITMTAIKRLLTAYGMAMVSQEGRQEGHREMSAP